MLILKSFLRTISFVIYVQLKRKTGDIGIYLIQVAASKTKIYMVLEYVNGGELFDKIVSLENLIRDVLLRLVPDLVNSDFHFICNYERP